MFCFTVKLQNFIAMLKSSSKKKQKKSALSDRGSLVSIVDNKAASAPDGGAPLSQQSNVKVPPGDVDERDKCGDFFFCGYKIMTLTDFMRRTPMSAGYPRRVCCCCMCCFCLCSARWGLFGFSVASSYMILYQAFKTFNNIEGWNYYEDEDENATHTYNCRDYCNCTDVTYEPFEGYREVNVSQLFFGALGLLGLAMTKAGAFLENQVFILAGVPAVALHILATVALYATRAALFASDRLCIPDNENAELTETKNTMKAALACADIATETTFDFLVLVSAYFYWSFLKYGGNSDPVAPPSPPKQPPEAKPEGKGGGKSPGYIPIAGAGKTKK